MNRVSGVITAPPRNLVQCMPDQPIGTFDLDLGGGEWCLGIDQSTSCTGLCFERWDGAFRVLLDVKHDPGLEDRVYFRELFKLLSQTVRGCTFKFVVMERPAPKAMLASRVLQELKGRVEEWVDMIPEFEGAIVDSLYPQTWKSYVIDKSKGKNRSKNKYAIAQDLSDKIFGIGKYLDAYMYGDYDSFDACGILYGYKKYAYDCEGNEMIHGVIEKSHASLVGYAWCSIEDPGSSIGVLGDFTKIEYPEILVYNEKYNLHKNIRMASSNRKFVLTVLPKECCRQLMWKYDIDVDDDSKYVAMYVLRKGKFSNGEINLFREQVPWNEEIYND